MIGVSYVHEKIHFPSNEILKQKSPVENSYFCQLRVNMKKKGKGKCRHFPISLVCGWPCLTLIEQVIEFLVNVLTNLPSDGSTYSAGLVGNATINTIPLVRKIKKIF